MGTQRELSRENTRTEISSGHVVLHRSMARLRMSERKFEVLKVLDPQSNHAYVLAVDERGKKVDFDLIRRSDEQAYYRKYGKIHLTLYEEIERRSDRELIPVVLWVAVEEEEVDQSKFDLGSLQEAPRTLLAYREQVKTALSHARDLLEKRFRVKTKETLKTVPVIFLELTSGQILELTQLDEVAGLFLHEKEMIEDLDDSMSVSGADDVVNNQGVTGKNIRVGVWERGADDLTDLRIEEHYDSARTKKSSHTRLVTAIIKNREKDKPHGYAPGAKIYAANKKGKEADPRALEWSVTEKECTVINQSFHRDSEPISGGLSVEDVLKDYLILHYPFPTIVQAAGNTGNDGIDPPTDEYVNHKSYNSLTVGNHDDSAEKMRDSSLYCNPVSPHGDRELPELCANGSKVKAVGLEEGGTSFASPAVAGSVAQLQEIDPTLRHWPEGNRAILLAGASKNVSEKTWWQSVANGDTGRDGSGALNIKESAEIARHQRSRDNSAVKRGWDVGTLSPSDFAENGYPTFSYQVKVPDEGGDRHVKVALAWNSKVTGSYPYVSSRLTLDFDLLIFAGEELVAWSTSFDNSYEITEFDGEPGKAYTIKIYKWSGDDSSWYGIAWTVH
jgi:Subtilase family